MEVCGRLAEADFHPYWTSDAVRSGNPGIHCSWGASNHFLPIGISEKEPR